MILLLRYGNPITLILTLQRQVSFSFPSMIGPSRITIEDQLKLNHRLTVNLIGMDKSTLYKAKFGEDRAAMIFDRVAQAGAEVGIKFSFGGKTGNTRNSHRLVQLGKSKSPEVQTRIVEELFEAYFEKEQDITSLEVLKKAGVNAGIDEKEVTDWLNSDKGGKQVDEEVMEARMERITGVPNYTVNDRYEVGGAQDPQVFLSLFEKIKTLEGRQSEM
jgi:predicted DsbA family dithiol-disulfide isomerase